MGISIVLEAKLPSKSFFARLKGKTNWQDEMFKVFTETMKEYGAVDFVPRLAERPEGRLPIHLCEEWPDITVNKDSLTLAARTSTCGPGYHAMFCAAVDAIEEKHGLKFFETDESCDDTGYFASRDYSELQKYFADWLRNLANSVSDRSDGKKNFRLQMPVGPLTPDGKADEFQTPAGPKKSNYLASLLKMDERELLRAAQDWYPWWNERLDAADFEKTARQIMWSDIPWRAADSEEEKQSYVAALAALSKAKALGRDISHLDQEVQEMREFLMNTSDDDSAPLKTGIGYRRQDCRWSLTPSWTGLLPGYLHEVFNEEDYQLFCDEFVVRLSSFSIEKNDNEFVSLGTKSEDEILAQGTKETHNWRIERSKDKAENGWLNSFVAAGSKDNLLIATFTHADSFNLSDIQRFVDSLIVRKNADE